MTTKYETSYVNCRAFIISNSSLSMIDILNKYLALYKSLNIPGVGSIFIETVPAVTDFVNRQIIPPYNAYRFDKYFDSPDKDFFNYLSSCKKIPDYEAIKLYNQFAQEIRSAIKVNGRVLWKDVGHFSKNDLGEIEFEQLQDFRDLYEPVLAERVIRNNTPHAVLVGDQKKTSAEMTELLHEEKKAKILVKQKTWMLTALILSAIALIVIFVHFYLHGFNWQSVANQQPVKLVQPDGH